MHEYDQDCHYGFHTIDYNVPKISKNDDTLKEVVDCHNDKCPEKYCKFSFFTGGHIMDSACEYYVPNRRRK